MFTKWDTKTAKIVNKIVTPCIQVERLYKGAVAPKWIKVLVMSTGNAEYKASGWKPVTITVKVK